MAYTEETYPILAAQGGEFITLNPNLIPPTHAKRLRNLTLENDLWETEPGTRKLNDVAITGGPTIGTLVHFSPAPGVDRLIATGRDGTLWKSDDDGVTWTQLTPAV